MRKKDLPQILSLIELPCDTEEQSQLREIWSYGIDTDEIKISLGKKTVNQFMVD
jgi:hypothetical protein